MTQIFSILETTFIHCETYWFIEIDVQNHIHVNVILNDIGFPFTWTYSIAQYFIWCLLFYRSIPRLIEVLGRLDVINSRVTEKLCDLFSFISRTFGHHITEMKVSQMLVLNSFATIEVPTSTVHMLQLQQVWNYMADMTCLLICISMILRLHPCAQNSQSRAKWFWTVD